MPLLYVNSLRAIFGFDALSTPSAFNVVGGTMGLVLTRANMAYPLPEHSLKLIKFCRLMRGRLPCRLKHNGCTVSDQRPTDHYTKVHAPTCHMGLSVLLTGCLPLGSIN